MFFIPNAFIYIELDHNYLETTNGWNMWELSLDLNNLCWQPKYSVSKTIPGETIWVYLEKNELNIVTICPCLGPELQLVQSSSKLLTCFNYWLTMQCWNLNIGGPNAVHVVVYERPESSGTYIWAPNYVGTKLRRTPTALYLNWQVSFFIMCSLYVSKWHFSCCWVVVINGLVALYKCRGLRLFCVSSVWWAACVVVGFHALWVVYMWDIVYIFS